VEASFSKITGNKTLEFGGVSPSNDLTRHKMESFYFYLITKCSYFHLITKCTDLEFCAPDDHPRSVLWGRWITRKMPDPRPSKIERA
jgi:hypothetical protein